MLGGWEKKKKEASTLTRSPAPPFFLVSDSSCSVNYWDTQQQRCLPLAPRAHNHRSQQYLRADTFFFFFLSPANFSTFVHSEPFFLF